MKQYCQKWDSKCRIPKAVRYGPKYLNGKGLVHLAVHQYASHLEEFLTNIRRESNLGNIMRIQMDNQQMLMGTEKHF